MCCCSREKSLFLFKLIFLNFLERNCAFINIQTFLYFRTHDLQSLTVAILKKFLTQYQLDTTGRKADLVDRLAAHIESLKEKPEEEEEASTETPSAETEAPSTETEAPASSTVCTNPRYIAQSPHIIFIVLHAICFMRTNVYTGCSRRTCSRREIGRGKMDNLHVWNVKKKKRRWVATVTLVISLY